MREYMVNGCLFGSYYKACQYADYIFNSTGIIVAVEEVK